MKLNLRARETLSDILGTKAATENNFDALRLIASSVVLISHAYPLVQGTNENEPLYRLTGTETFGHAAACVFFFISGLLVTTSFMRSRGLGEFAWKRSLRLLPGLFVVCLLTVFVLGPIETELPLGRYFTDPGTYAYAQNAALLMKYDLPGVFWHNPGGNAVNGSLWTLTFEFICYVIVALAGVLGLLRYRYVCLAAWLLSFLVPPLVELTATQTGIAFHIYWIAKFFTFFGAGACAYLFRDAVPIDWRLAAIAGAVCLALSPTPLFDTAFATAGCYFILVFAYKGWSGLRVLTRYGDFSYGIYIYAYPIQQCLVALGGFGATVLGNSLIAWPITVLAGALSWHLVEKPALALKHLRWHKSQRVSGPASGGG